MNLSELYKEIDSLESLLAEKRIEYARKALQENGGGYKIEV